MINHNNDKNSFNYSFLNGEGMCRADMGGIKNGGGG